MRNLRFSFMELSLKLCITIEIVLPKNVIGIVDGSILHHQMTCIVGLTYGYSKDTIDKINIKRSQLLFVDRVILARISLR